MEKFYFSMEKTRGQRNQHASWITNFAQNILPKWWLKRKTVSPLNYQKRVLRRGNSTTVGTVIISQKWANSSRVPICQHSKLNDSYKVVSGNYRRGPSINHNSTHDFPVRQFMTMWSTSSIRGRTPKEAILSIILVTKVIVSSLDVNFKQLM